MDGKLQEVGILKEERMVRGMPRSEYRKWYYQQNKKKVKDRMKRYYEENKEELRKKAKEYYHENKDQLKKIRKDYFTIYRLLFGHSGSKIDGLANGYSICLSCGESFPLFLVTHHIYGRNISDETITLCANCHQFIGRIGQKWFNIEWMFDD
jgi:hypothetical protein